MTSWYIRKFLSISLSSGSDKVHSFLVYEKADDIARKITVEYGASISLQSYYSIVSGTIVSVLVWDSGALWLVTHSTILPWSIEYYD